jgi:hypothetical protein
MKRAVSISLGNPSRNKRVLVKYNDVEISVERIGTGGDIPAAKKLFTDLDGKVDALSVGGIDCYVTLDGHDYPIYSALKLVENVHQTPWVDGRHLKYVLEKRLFELIAPVLGEPPRFKKCFMPFCTDRVGLIEAVSSICDEVILGDLMFMFGIPMPIQGLKNFRRTAHALLPLISYLPLTWLFPPGVSGEEHKPKFKKYWQDADLIAGDMHYISKYAPFDLHGKWVITNTTTDENINLLRERGVKKVITTSPRYDGRSFGINMMEAVLTAYAGKGRALSRPELNELVDEVDLRPSVMDLN